MRLKELVAKMDKAKEKYNFYKKQVEEQKENLQKVCNHPDVVLEYVSDNSYTECGNAQVDYEATERYYECQLCGATVTRKVR